LKSDTFTTLTHFFVWVSTQFRRPARALQCDNSREFDNHASRSFFLANVIQLRLSCPYTSVQNGRAERMIRTTTNMICCLLFQASLPTSYWIEALHTTTHLPNRLPSKVSYDHLRVFGCACYPNTSATAPHKLSPRYTRCLFLATLLTARGIDVLTSPPVASSLITSSSTKTCFTLLTPPHPPISTPCLSLIRVPIPPRHLASHRCPHRAWLHRPSMRPRQPRLRRARPRRRAGLTSLTPPSFTTAAGALLPRRADSVP
jgi:hypothetical protein